MNVFPPFPGILADIRDAADKRSKLPFARESKIGFLSIVDHAHVGLQFNEKRCLAVTRKRHVVHVVGLVIFGRTPTLFPYFSSQMQSTARYAHLARALVHEAAARVAESLAEDVL